MTAGAVKPEDSNKPAKILCLPCAKLEDHPLHMDFYAESHLSELVESIRESGMLEPVVVYPQAEGQYRILSGHYRVRAVRRLKWKKVMCRVVECDTRTATVLYCVSNLLSRGVSPMEEAYMFSRMVTEEKYTLAEIGKIWGRSKSWVSRRLSLLTHLDPRLKKELGLGYLSPRMAQELLRLPRGNDQERVLKLIRRDHLSKDAAAQLVSRWLNADEQEKQQLEKACNTRKAEQAPSVRNLVRAQLAQCTQLIAGIAGMAEHQTGGSWWPMDTYRAFLKTAAHLDKVLSSMLSASGEVNPCEEHMNSGLKGKISGWILS